MHSSDLCIQCAQPLAGAVVGVLAHCIQLAHTLGQRKGPVRACALGIRNKLLKLLLQLVLLV